ncbi:MAG TPA: SprT-like domain-containing protein [Chthoniobacterales bacterium]|jgi:predicted SprT family Zn-dependent metalloprotease
MVKKSIQQAGQLFLDLFRTQPAPPRRARSGVSKDEALTKQAADLLIAAGAVDVAQKVKVVWNSRLSTTAGMARYRENLVVLNPRLQDFSAEEVDRTLRHELAHLLAHARHRRSRIAPHGDEWRQACCDLGLEDEKRCHELPLPRRTVERKHFYACSYCGTTYPRVRPIRRKVACLKCCRAHNRGQFHERFVLRKIR